MPRPTIELQPAEVRLLRAWAEGRGRIAERSRVVLLSADGLSAEEVARRLGLAVPTVYKWRKRFRTLRLSGLKDLPRPGQPRRLSQAQRDELVRWTTQELAPDFGHWTIRTLAQKLNVTEHQVREAWTAARLRPHVLRAARLTSHAALSQRHAAPLGLYLGPPFCALALQPGPRCTNMTDRVSTSASPEPSGARSARSDSVHAAFRSAALTTALRVERHSARLEELLGFARAMCRRAHGKPLHLALSVGGLNSRRTRQLEAQLGSTLTVHHLVTNEAWLLCVDRWLLERTRAPSPPAIAHLRNSLAQHAHEHAPEQGATFAWICPPAPECPTRPAEAPIHAMPPG